MNEKVVTYTYAVMEGDYTSSCSKDLFLEISFPVVSGTWSISLPPGIIINWYVFQKNGSPEGPCVCMIYHILTILIWHISFPPVPSVPCDRSHFSSIVLHANFPWDVCSALFVLYSWFWKLGLFAPVLNGILVTVFGWNERIALLLFARQSRAQKSS